MKGAGYFPQKFFEIFWLTRFDFFNFWLDLCQFSVDQIVCKLCWAIITFPVALQMKIEKISFRSADSKFLNWKLNQRAIPKAISIANEAFKVIRGLWRFRQKSIVFLCISFEYFAYQNYNPNTIVLYCLANAPWIQCALYLILNFKF